MQSLRIKRFITLTLSILLCLSICSCRKNSSQKQESKEFKVYIDIKDKNSISIIRYLTEEYTKKNPKTKLKINDVLGGGSSISEDISQGGKADLLITSRNTMIELSQKGLISDMSQYYENYKIGEKYYNIMSAYGRVGDKYYGIGLLPYLITVFYNKDAASKLGISAPSSVKDLLGLLKKLNENNIRIPIIMPEDIDINIALSSIIASNREKMSALEAAYDNKEQYKNLKEMQEVFNDINTAVNQGGIGKNSFEIGNESTLTSLLNGSIPVVISTSYYYDKLKEGNINAIGDITMDNKMKANMPVIMDIILCMPTNAKNSEEVGKFLEFILGEDTQDKLEKKGYISANKKASEKLTGLGKNIVNKLSSANENSILYTYNLPNKFNKVISSKIDNIFSGNYSKKEWEEIISEVYK